MSQARHGTADQLSAPPTAVDGIFLVGMFASGVELLGGALTRLGLPAVCDDQGLPGARALTKFNDRLLATAARSPGGPPDAAPVELAHLLAPRMDEARRKMTVALGETAADVDVGPRVWADPRLSFLAPFWADALSVHPAVILVHRGPGQVAVDDMTEVADRTSIVDWWDRYNRSALVLCSRFPSLVINYDDVVCRPKVVLTEVVEFLLSLGMAIDGDMGQAVDFVEGLALGQETEAAELVAIDHPQRTLDRLLNQLDGQRAGVGAGAADTHAGLVEITAEFYDEDYYKTGCDKAGVPYNRGEKVWVDFFASVAGNLVKTLQPGTVLDVGCALGMLVEALRERGVDARGIDISSWAIEQVPAALKPFCNVGSVTEDLDGRYDLITCIEVMEHLPPSLADACIANLCRHAEMVLFSSTPDDFEEPTHLNVEPGSYWAQLFLRHGFVRDFGYDATFLARQAVLFRRMEADVEELVEGYEQALWRTSTEYYGRLRDAVDEHDQLADAHNQLADEHNQLAETHNRLVVQSDAVIAERDQFQREATHLSEALDNAQRRRAAENLASFEMVRQFEMSQRRLAALVSARDLELEQIRNTKTFRYTTKLRGLYARLRRRRVTVQSPPPSVFPADGTYQTWVELFDTLDDARRVRIDASVRALIGQPKISVLMPVYDPPVHLLRSAIDSVRNQIYQNWELCIADDRSTDPQVVQLLEECTSLDGRIRVIRRQENGHISAASNSALSLATGQWVAPLDHDDVLAEHALALVALTLSEHPNAGIVYSDEDKLDESGQRCDPFFKPDFDPLLLLGQNFVNHLSVIRKDLVDQVGGYREGYEGSQDWDLILRTSELIGREQVVHIPYVLYHWRVHASSTASMVSAKPYAIQAGQRAVVDHVQRTGRSARVMRIGKSGHNRVCWDLPNPAPRVSIIIPTRDGQLLQRCIDSLLDITTYPDYEVVVVDNSSRTLPTLEYLQTHDDRITVIRDERPFNYAAINNYAVERTSGDVICLLNDDTEVISGEWLSEMVSQLVQPGVGAVGAKLYYDDWRIQHAGVVLGIGGVAGHAYRMASRLSSGYYGNLQLAHRMSAVTAACIVVRREAWNQVNGLDEENLPVAFNDVDFCLRLRAASWEVVWTPHAQLLHHESISRGPDDRGPRAEAFAREVTYMELRWGVEGLRNDPYYNPNLSLDAEDFSLAWPPRTLYDTTP